MKKDEILDYLRNSPGWKLQYCRGITGNGWWWLRRDNDGPDTVPVNSTSAKAAAKKLKRLPMRRFGQTDYVLMEGE